VTAFAPGRVNLIGEHTAVAELQDAGYELTGCRVEVQGTVPRGSDGPLDQIASLCGQPEHALRIDSLRDCYEVSTPKVEQTVARLRDAGAIGARIVGGEFGGHVLGLFAPGFATPAEAITVRPGPGAHLV
jgi:galactokinase